jgi:hypothetical protein
MPECPKDLNEPKYLALLYDQTCTVGGDDSPELSSESDHVDYSSAHERRRHCTWHFASDAAEHVSRSGKSSFGRLLGFLLRCFADSVSGRFVSDISLRRVFGKEDTALVMPLLLPIARIWSHTIMPNVLKRGGVDAVDDAAKVVASLRALGKDSSEWTRHAEQREHFVRVEMFERLLTKARYAKFMIPGA